MTPEFRVTLTAIMAHYVEHIDGDPPSAPPQPDIDRDPLFRILRAVGNYGEAITDGSPMSDGADACLAELQTIARAFAAEWIAACLRGETLPARMVIDAAGALYVSTAWFDAVALRGTGAEAVGFADAIRTAVADPPA